MTNTKICSIGTVDIEKKLRRNSGWNNGDPCNAMAKHNKSINLQQLEKQMFEELAVLGKEIGK